MHRVLAPAVRTVMCALLLSFACAASHALEAIQNGNFENGLQGWEIARDAPAWPVLLTNEDSTISVSMHPGKAYRGPLIYQNLNVSGVAGSTVTASFDLERLDNYQTCGRSIALYLEYVTNSGEHREARLLNPGDCDYWGGTFSGSFTVPADAARLTRLSLVRVDKWGLSKADNVSLTVPDTAVVEPVPVISSISRESGSYGQSLTINGSGFGNLPFGRVTIGGAPAGFINTWTNTQISLTLAPPATSGPVRVIVNGVESNGYFPFTVESPHYRIESSWGPTRAVRGQTVRIPIGVRYVSGFSSGTGVTFSISAGPAAPAAFQPSAVRGTGGTVLSIGTDGLAQGDYIWTITASEPSGGTVSFPVRVRVQEVGSITFYGEGPGGTISAVNALTRDRQGLFVLTADARDLQGQEISEVDLQEVLSWTSSNPQKVLAVRERGSWRFSANENGAATLTVTTPHGFSANLPVTVSFPASPSFTLLTVTPSVVDNSGSATVAIAAEAAGISGNFYPTYSLGGLSGGYSNGGFRYDAVGDVGTLKPLGQSLVTVRNESGEISRSAAVTVINAPTRAVIRGFVFGLPAPDQSNPDDTRARVSLYDANTGELRLFYDVFSFANRDPRFEFAGIAPGSYKLQVTPSDPPEDGRFYQPQWYPNAGSFAEAASIVVPAGGTAENLNLFYTKGPRPNPEVVETWPAAFSTGVLLDTSISVRFDRPMYSVPFEFGSDRTFVVRDGNGNRVNGQYGWSYTENRATFTPDQPLLPLSNYYVVVTTNAQSEDGLHLLSDVQWMFTTGNALLPPLQVLQVYPAPGDTGVPTNTLALARLSQPVSAGSLDWDSFTLRDESLTPVWGTVEAVGDVLVFRSFNPLNSFSIYTATISGNVRDIHGRELGTDYSWSFTTGEISGGTPRVVLTIPAPGATSVPVSTPVLAFFDQEVQTATINGTSFTLEDSNVAPVEGSVSAGPSHARFTPSGILQEGQTYTARLSSSIESVLGSPLESEFSWQFTVGAAETGGPRVVAVYPEPGSSGASPNTAVLVLFDRDISSDSISSASLTLRDGFGNPLEGSVAIEGRVLRLEHWNWLAGLNLTATVSGSVRDTGWRPLGSDYSWSFTTSNSVTPPKVVFTVPEDGETDADPWRAIIAYFDRAMLASSINATSFLLQDELSNNISGLVASYGYSTEFYPDPSGRLEPGVTYTATLTANVKGLDGQPLPSNYSWTFTTGQPGLFPGFLQPYPGEENVDPGVTVTVYLGSDVYSDVDPDTVTALTFSVEDADGIAVNGARQVSGGFLSFYPDEPLAPERLYRVRLGTGIRSLDGRRLRQPYSWTFTTGQPGMKVVFTVPYGGMPAWWRSRPIQVVFDDSPAPATVNNSTFQVRQGGVTPVAGTFNVTGQTVTFTPASPLSPGSQYTVTLTTGIQTAEGKSLQSQYQWPFTVAANPLDRIGSLRGLPDGTGVALTGKAVHYADGLKGYLEEADRSSGIRADLVTDPSLLGREVSVSGILTTTGSGERIISVLSFDAGGALSVAPVGVTNRALRGRMLDGMNVRTWGRVTSVVDANTVIISDGSDDPGIRVSRPGSPISAPAGSVVAVTGAAGWENGRVIHAVEITQLAP